jgi:protein-S-isoprenylcysteine O-methyltransferase Ste14
MSLNEPKREGRVSHILELGQLSERELVEQLWQQDISFVRTYDRPLTYLILALGVLWVLPAVAQWLGWAWLRPLAQLPRLSFPRPVMVVSAVLFAASIGLEAWLSVIRYSHGGCKDLHETVLLIKEGPYAVIRHPGYLADLFFFALLPVLVHGWVPFTALAALLAAAGLASIAYLIRAEDGFNLRKWGRPYRQYMDEVPAVDFVTGWRRFRQRAHREHLDRA